LRTALPESSAASAEQGLQVKAKIGATDTRMNSSNSSPVPACARNTYVKSRCAKNAKQN
jgi:hypothetical protein